MLVKMNHASASCSEWALCEGRAACAYWSAALWEGELESELAPCEVRVAAHPSSRVTSGPSAFIRVRRGAGGAKASASENHPGLSTLEGSTRVREQVSLSKYAMSECVRTQDETSKQ